MTFLSCILSRRGILPLAFVALVFLACVSPPASFGAGTTATAVAAAPAAKAPPASRAEVLAGMPITPGMALRGVLILVLFGVIATLIATRKVPAMIALPIMAAGIAIIAGVLPFDPPGTPAKDMQGFMATVLEGKKPPNVGSPKGAFHLYEAIIYTLFGGMFARFISDAKIAERIIKFAAEFGGEDPFLLSLIMSAITIMIFTAIGGLPAIIMLGTVMFPVLLSLGVPPAVCGGMLLMAFPIGSNLNPAVWASTPAQYGISIDQAMTFFLSWAAVQTVMLFVFLSVEFLRMKRSTVTPRSVLRSIGIVLLFVTAAALVGYGDQLLALMMGGPTPLVDKLVMWRGRAWLAFQWLAAAVVALALVQTQWQYWVRRRVTAQWNLLTPLMPIVLILVLGFTRKGAGNETLVLVAPAFMLSMAYGYLTTPRERGMQRLGKSVMDGVTDVAAPVVLMLGIGMLLAAAMHPKTGAVLTPIMARIIPTTPVGYVLFFLVASPLALYRGPLNEFGLGVGIANLLQNFMPAAATMGAIKSVGMLQDPTTTQNVWVCGYLKLDINALLFKLFAYSLVLVFFGLILSAYLFFGR